jgi:hypothetical protein
MRAERLRRFGADPQPGVERRGLIVHVRQRRPAAVVVDRPLTAWPNHNVLEHGREIVLCETSRGRLLAVDRETRAERSVEVQPASGFLRGLAWLDGDRFVVGSRRPAALHVVDLDTRAVGPTLSLSKEWHESVHDIAHLPDDWDDPPAGLAV